MLITQTPLRVSIAGGGTDFREFFRHEGGAVLSFAIDKFVYVIVKERFDDMIYVNYSQKEIVETVDDLKHNLVREAMRKTGVERGVEITTLADVPSEGTGLGSSSSITVGLLNALYAYQGVQVTAEQLAREASEIEIEILGKPMGIQDHYIAAYGGLRFIEFAADGEVRTRRVEVAEARQRRFISNLLLFYTAKTRHATQILAEQKRNVPHRLAELRELRRMAYEALDRLTNNSLDSIGHLLHRAWLVKQTLAPGISLPEVEETYARAREVGALGGKLCGAG
ncbi:MAG: GHMP kinase, partial [Chloroflexi bacterium]|nr:GHMP kinase [Chloroflexota bacterium]